jgi:hypothetical protein
VTQELWRYFPILYHSKMTKEELIDSRFSLMKGPSDTVFQQLHILNKTLSAVTELKLITTSQNKTEIEYKLDLTKISEDHKTLLYKFNPNNKDMSIQGFYNNLLEDAKITNKYNIQLNEKIQSMTIDKKGIYI